MSASAKATTGLRPRLAIVVSHPIQHFAPLYRELTSQAEVELKVFFCCDWGVKAYHDPAFDRTVEWDVPLLEGYTSEFLASKRRPKEISFLEVDNPDVGRRLEEFEPDVVLVHGYGCRTMWRAVRWARTAGKRTLLSSDSHAAREVPAWKKAVKAVVVGFFYRQLDGALAAGESNREYHRLFGLPPERIYPTVLPVDGTSLRARTGDPLAARREIRDRLGVSEGAFVALFCGNLTPWKRPLDFATAVVRAAREDAGVYGVVVGDGPERPGLERIGAGPGGGHVKLAGFVNQSAIGRYYAAADVLVLTSERDAHPLVVTEGLFFGLPVLLSDRIGCIGEGDTARPGKNALVFPCGDLGHLAGALLALRRDGAALRSMSEASARIAAENDAPVAARLFSGAVREIVRLGRRKAKACDA